MLRHRLSALLLALSLGGCAAETAKGPESNEPQDGKADSFRAPTEHGLVAFGEGVGGVLGEGADFHAYDFVLTSAAEVSVETFGDLDTVLYLYQMGDRGWGSYIAKDDDGGDEFSSLIEASLDAGTYRILLKGYSQSEIGDYDILVECSGEGCAASESLPPFGTFQLFSDLYDFPDETAPALLSLRAASAPDGFDGAFDLTIASDYGFEGDYTFGYYDAYTAGGEDRIRFVNDAGDEVHDFAWTSDDGDITLIDNDGLEAEFYALNVNVDADEVIDCVLFDLDNSEYFEEGLSLLEYNDVSVSITDGGHEVSLGAASLEATSVTADGEHTIIEMENVDTFSIVVPNEGPRRGELRVNIDGEDEVFGRILCATE